MLRILWIWVRNYAGALPPPALLAIFYAVLVVIGGLVLWLPPSNTGGVGLGDALFMSTSAVTVTGLVVVDPGSSFTLLGQVTLAVLVQLGGLGLMTFAVIVLSAVGVPIGMPQRLILREELKQSSIADLFQLVRVILSIALICEATGAVLLAFVFVPEFGLWPGLWQAVFHSISAFNNAGIQLAPDGLSRWVGNPIVNIVVPALFIVGGIGFVVLSDLHQKRRWRALTLHSKLMLAGTAVLILWSWPMFAVLEWTNPGTLGGLDGTAARLWASWFQAVSPRTAGFNTLDTTQMHDATAMMTITLMMVGGGSTSTAGGIKVTTLIVLILATIAFFRRRETLHIFGRSLGQEEVMKVMALTTVSILIVFTALFVLTISHDGAFLPLVFEVTSAFGTVGLSMGATADLDGIGRAVIAVVMFLGRVGPLTLGFFLASHGVARVRYPAGQIHLG